MPSLRKIGFFLGEEKATVVEFKQNAPFQVVSSPLGSKTNTASPFSSSLTEEIQITAILQKMLQDHQMTGGSFYVSMPKKEIILRSFIIPFVKQQDLPNVIKFEAKKYLPFDIQELSYVFDTIPFDEGPNKRLMVVLFATRKEVLAFYERVFKQVNAEVDYCEPYMVSLTKALLFRKEIKPTDHLAVLILEKNMGHICFIDQGIPQFIREFPISPASVPDESNDFIKTLNLKIVNEVGNSFDFYARQFNGEKLQQMLILGEAVRQDLLDVLETEIKVKLTVFSPSDTMGLPGQGNDMDAIYAMGACVSLPTESVSKFNFLGNKIIKQGIDADLMMTSLKLYKDVILVFLFCVVFLAGTNALLEGHLKVVKNKYDKLASQEGAFLNEPLGSIQAEAQQNTSQLQQYKGIKTKSDIAFIILKVASHLPQGTMLKTLNMSYDQSDSSSENLTIEMQGYVFKEDANDEISAVSQIFSDFKNDKELAKFFKNVTLASLNREELNKRQVTSFKIDCR